MYDRVLYYYARESDASGQRSKLTPSGRPMGGIPLSTAAVHKAARSKYPYHFVVRCKQTELTLNLQARRHPIATCPTPLEIPSSTGELRRGEAAANPNPDPDRQASSAEEMQQWVVALKAYSTVPPPSSASACAPARAPAFAPPSLSASR